LSKSFAVPLYKMIKKILTVFVACVFALAAFGADSKPAILKLSDGRTFSAWAIMSQTASAVVVKHKGGIVKIDKKLLPPDVLSLYPINEAKAEAEAAALARAKQAGDERRAEVEAQQQREYQLRLARAQAGQPSASAAANGPAAVAVLSPADHQKAAQALRDRTERYFRGEFRNGATYSYIRDVSIDNIEIAPNQGWPGEYTISGKGHVTYYDSRYRGQNQVDSRDVTATIKFANGAAVLSDFRQR
jgi:hypothetical protein